MKQILLDSLSTEWKKDRRTKEKVLCCVVHMRQQQKIVLYVNLTIKRRKDLTIRNTDESEKKKKKGSDKM